MNKCRVLVVGAGMYTCGKGKNEYGTILPSLIEANNLGIVDEISIVTRSSDSLHHANEKCKIIKEAMRSNITIDIHQADMTDINQVDNILKKFLPDAAIISVPDHIHSKVSIPIINNRISCLVVKPMATKIQDGLEMLEALKNAGVVGQVEFHKRLDESNLILRDKFFEKPTFL